MGVFAIKNIPERTRLGEYQGKLISQDEYDNLPAEKCEYVFEIEHYKGGKRKKVYVDARFKKYSNWTRYVNGAKSAEQQDQVNVDSYQYRGKLFYRTTQPVKTGEELIVDYGSDYWTDDEDSSDDESSYSDDSESSCDEKAT